MISYACSYIVVLVCEEYVVDFRILDMRFDSGPGKVISSDRN